MGRSRAGGAAEESNKKKSKKEQVEEEDETEAGEEDEEALEEDDKENEQPEEQKEDEDGEEEQEAGDGNEEDGAAANKGKRKHAVAESTSNKKAKAAAGDGHSVVLAYMLRMNRPYSAINVADNIQGALSKSQTVKVLEDLTSQGKLTAKEFGKSKVYFAMQKDKDASPDEMAKVDKQLTEATEQLNRARAATSSLQSEVSAACAEPDDDTLESELAELEKSVPAAEKKLAAMKGGKDAMPAADVEALQRQFNLYLAEWKRRKRGCRELIGLVAEHAAKSWKADQGIETDEAVKVKLEDWQAYFRDVKPLPKEVKGKGKKK